MATFDGEEPDKPLPGRLRRKMVRLEEFRAEKVPVKP
jgi:hypothetical protein